MAYHPPMRRTLVLALALLSIALMGGSCEFRASSGTAHPSNPPETEPSAQDSGFLLVIRSGETISPSTDTTSGSGLISEALAVSVLSSPSPSQPLAPEGSAGASPDSEIPIADFDGDLAGPSAATEVASIEAPIPEPHAILLFGLGTLFLVSHIRRRR